MSASRVRYGQAYVEITGDDNKLTKALKHSINNIREFGQKASAVGASIARVGAVMFGAFALPVKAASDLQETMAKFEVVFGNNAKAVKTWGDAFAKEIGRSEEQIASFMASSQDLFVPLGFAASAATEMSKQITRLSIDLASFNNMQDASVLRDLQAALTGSGEVMKKYGVILSEAAVNQELLNMGMDPKAATNMQKVQARLNIIMAGTTAAQGDAIRSGGSLANQWKRTKGELSDAAAEIGTALVPAVTSIVKTVGSVIRSVRSWSKDNQKLILNVAKLGGGLLALGLTLSTFGHALTAIAGTMKGLLLLGPKIAAMFTFLMAHPAIAVAAAIASIGIAIGMLIKSMREQRFEAGLSIKVYEELLEAQKKVADQAKQAAASALAEVEARVNALNRIQQQLADVMKQIAEAELSEEDKKIKKAKDLLAKRLELVKAARAEQKAIKAARIEAEYRERRAAREARKTLAVSAQKTAREAMAGQSPEEQARLRRQIYEASQIESQIAHEELLDFNRKRRELLRLEAGPSPILDAQEAAIRQAGAKGIAAAEAAKAEALRKRQYEAAKKRGQAVDVSGVFGMARRLLGTAGAAISTATDKAIGGLRSTTMGQQIGGVVTNLMAAARGMQRGVAQAGRGGFIASTLAQGGEDMQVKNTDYNKRTAEATEKLAEEGLGIGVD